MALARELLKLFAIGTLNGVQVKTLAAAAWTDGGGHGDETSRRLSSGGTTNAARDVVNAARLGGFMSTQSQPYEVALPGGKGSVFMMLPHEVLHGMVGADPSPHWVFGDRAGDPAEPLASLVQRWCDHPDVQCDTDPGRIVMIGMHADGVSYASSLRAGDGRKIIVGSWNVISSPDAEIRNIRQPLFVIGSGKLCGCGCSGFCSFQRLFEVLAWSFRCLLDGEAPGARHDGSPFGADERRLPPGTALPRAGLLQLRGDWEYMSTVFRLRWFTSHRFCWMCQATNTPGPLCFKDFSPHAAHRGTLLSHRDYLEACAAEGSQPSAIFQVPGVILDFLVVDAMHAADLGVFQDFRDVVSMAP
jgi:hypothetical protein